MDKLDLDISKYSCEELKDVFNLDKNIDCEEINVIIDRQKNNIFTDDNLNLDEKNNITSFLNRVLEKLVTSADPTSSNNLLIPSAPLSHPIIVNPNTIEGREARSSDGRPATFNDYPPGFINPINIKSIKSTLNVDTRFRTLYYATKSTDFLVTIPEKFKKIVNMRLSSLDLPMTIYTINKDFENMNFSISTTVGGALIPIVIGEGNYSSLAPIGENNCPYIVDAINSAIETALGGTDISCIINPANQKLSFSKATVGEFAINFNVNPDGDVDPNTPLPLKLGWLLGFRAGSYTSVDRRITSEGICSVIGPRYIYLSIDDFTKAGNNNYVAAFESSTLSPNIIARINYQSLVQSKGIYKFGEDDDFSDSFNRSREYFGPVDIQKLHFQILDEYGRVVNFNTMDWSCALTFNVLYD